MASLHITVPQEQSLKGKVAIITGASSGIGLSTAKLFVAQGAQVYNLDVHPSAYSNTHTNISFIHCDQSSWRSLLDAFNQIPAFDIAVANAGILERFNYFEDSFNAEGELEEPSHKVVDVNFVGTMQFVKIALSRLRKQGKSGSVVMTASCAGYMAENQVPMYSAGKTALLGLLRALRPDTMKDNITLNAVAPGPTRSGIIPSATADQISKVGITVNEPEHVAKAILHSVIATEETNLEAYDDKDLVHTTQRWHGRCIFALGDAWTEIEEPLVQGRAMWLGEEMEKRILFQQKFTRAAIARQREELNAKEKNNGV